MKSILIGSVGSSKVVLDQMIRKGFPVNMVFSLDEHYSEKVSGYEPIHEVAIRQGLPYKKFRRISDEENKALIQEIAPDYIFVIGLSQLIPQEIIDMAKAGVIGFHPTPLPKFRGRAALVWQVLLGVHDTKCSMFFIDKGIDSGDILGQEPYVIEETDYVGDVKIKLLAALEKLADRVLSQIMEGALSPVKQNEEEATYLLMRTPEDGKINWKEPGKNIFRLIRAVSKPYPGAFGMYDGEHKIILWRAGLIENKHYIGIPGQICKITEDYFDVLCVDSILRVTEFDNMDRVKLRVGHKLR